MQRFTLSLALSISIAVLFISPLHSVAAAEVWLQVQSKNFTLIGNASEKEIRKVGLRLEQFREAVSRFFNQPASRKALPITVIVFRDDRTYNLFKPLYQGKPSVVSGYFQSSADSAIITLKADWQRSNPYSVIFHEYVHLLTSGGVWRLPTWLSEGIAEYYSTFEVNAGDQAVVSGKAIDGHIRLLRERQLLPLRTLFAVDQASQFYNEEDKKSLFYAQSWALVHFLLLGDSGKRQHQFFQFVNSLGLGKPVDDSFREAFKTDYAAIEQGLNDYILRNIYPSQIVSLEQRLEYDTTMRTSQLSDAEVQSYLGDLLWHIHRVEEAEVLLQRAIALEPNLAIAHTSLGLLRVRQGRFSEAKKHFQRAIAAGSQNYLAHYYHAYSLQWEQVDETRYVSHFGEGSVKEMRASLEKARELAPDFADTYKQLAFINLVLNENLDEAVILLKRAISLAPHREDLAYTLAQIYVRQQNYSIAREIAEKIARGGVNEDNRDRAKTMLEVIKKVQEQLARLKAERPAEANQPHSETTSQTSAPAGPGRRFEGDQVQGLLTRIDCGDKEITLTVKSGARLLRFHTPSLGRLIFVRYTSEIPTSITCGAINPAKPVIVTYRKTEEARLKFDGEPVGVEFIKPDRE
jgi:tetratricopeptide (TPR) repeat protein